MSILFRDQPTPIEARTRLPYPHGVDLAAQMRGSSSVNVTTDTAMRHDAVWSCRTRIAEDVAMMPVDVIRYVNGSRQEVTPVPQIVAAPSVVTSDPMDWRYQVVMSWTGDGNAWGLVTSTTVDGRHPTRIELKAHTSIRFQATGDEVRIFVDNVEEDLWPVGRLWHSPAYTVPGQLLGLSPIQHHATVIGKGMAAGLHGFQYFSDGAHPTSIWKLKGGTADQAKTFKERLMGLASGNREPMVVDADQVSMERLQSNPSDSQFLETEKYSVEQVCRIFNCDPADHGASGGGSSLTYSNRADAGLARLERRQYWVTKLENVLSGFVPRPQVARLNTDASLKMSPQERHELNALRLKSKTLTVNEVRKQGDEAPFDGDEFDEPGIPGLDEVDPTRNPDPGRSDRSEVVPPVPLPAPPSFTVHNHVPEGRDIVIPAPEVTVDVAPADVRVDAPITVETPEQRAPVINVEAPQITVEAPAPVERADVPPVVNVNVEPTPVIIENNIETPRSKHKVRRDDKGNIIEIEEKPA